MMVSNPVVAKYVFFILGEFHRFGVGDALDLHQACDYLAMSARQGYASAQYTLAKHYYLTGRGWNSEDKNSHEAVRLLSDLQQINTLPKLNIYLEFAMKRAL